MVLVMKFDFILGFQNLNKFKYPLNFTTLGIKAQKGSNLAVNVERLNKFISHLHKTHNLKIDSLGMLEIGKAMQMWEFLRGRSVQLKD